MSRQNAIALAERYYAAFNVGDAQAMLDCLADDVVHDINQGSRQQGKEAFREFLAHMGRCYRERLSDVVIMSDDTGTRLAAEFVERRVSRHRRGLARGAGTTLHFACWRVSCDEGRRDHSYFGLL